MILRKSFYDGYTPKVAQDLLGCFLVREFRGKPVRGIITETEAYRGEYDLASHASKGKTQRTKLMYGLPGHAYIYLVYGMHQMLNVVTEGEGFPAAVLIRAVDASTEASIDVSKINSRYTNGPGKLTKFMHIDKALNGHDLTRGEKLWIEQPTRKTRGKIIRSPRVGVDYARHCKNWKWNFRLVD